MAIPLPLRSLIDPLVKRPCPLPLGLAAHRAQWPFSKFHVPLWWWSMYRRFTNRCPAMALSIRIERYIAREEPPQLAPSAMSDGPWAQVYALRVHAAWSPPRRASGLPRCFSSLSRPKTSPPKLSLHRIKARPLARRGCRCPAASGLLVYASLRGHLVTTSD